MMLKIKGVSKANLIHEQMPSCTFLRFHWSHAGVMDLSHSCDLPESNSYSSMEVCCIC